MDVDTRSLRYFIEVAEQLNFTRASERLFVSQPALSRRIRALEDGLRTTLFERDGREVRLTAAGESLLPAARRLVADWQAAQRVTRVAAAERARVLRVAFEALCWPLDGASRPVTDFAGVVRHLAADS
ncbi:regulatory helix-turn-helix protein, lysR family [Actinomadura madurae]|uniref:Regulatory helix-turn-helix protein, lysR family n=1 Tax=Actinomadura madurae TaxID=1993 RepID=A0A1I4Y3P2_9ACTN|nr:regulatory helix-turn-helix protein, lysR family [Actinomadura madurae]SPT63770.1 Hca operon transcriptional activator [Actinomadura madurae]